MPTPDEMRVWAEAEQRVMRQYRAGLRVDQGLMGDAVPVSSPMGGGGLSIFLAYFKAYKTGQLVEATLSTEPGATVIEAQGIVRGENGASSVELNHVDVRPRLAVNDPVRIVALGETGYQILDAFYLTDEVV